MIIVQTVFEFFLIGLIILGIIFEPKLVAWERKTFSKIRKWYHNQKAAAKRKHFVVLTNKDI